MKTEIKQIIIGSLVFMFTMFYLTWHILDRMEILEERDGYTIRLQKEMLK